MPDTDDRRRDWREWWQGTLSEFLNVHFTITLIVLLFWIIAVWGPLGSLSALILRLGDVAVAELSDRVEVIESVTSNVVAISGIFTTVVGLVLGHYFGQRGQERARLAAEAKSEEAIGLLDEATDETTDVIEAQEQELDRVRSALGAAIRMITGDEDVDMDLLGQLLGTPGEGEGEADEEDREEDRPDAEE